MAKVLDTLKGINDKLRRRTVNLGVFASFMLVFAASLFVTAAMFVIQPNGTDEMIEILIKGRATFFLNWAPILLAMLALYLATGAAALSAGIVGALVVLMSVINRELLYVRAMPLKPLDILLSREVTAIAGVSDISIIGMMLAAAPFAVIALIGIAYFIRSKPMMLRLRLCAAAAVLSAIVVMSLIVFGNKGIYNNLYVKGSRYNETDISNSKGFVYVFIYMLHDTRIAVPGGYTADRQQIESIMAGFVPEDKSSVVKPHIILILSEAFSELSLSEVFVFDGFDDPLENYTQIKEESYYGRMVVHSSGGGTADAEFDVLTGLSTANYKNQPYSYALLTKPFPSLASTARGLGYEAVAIHPFSDWYYNRTNAYRQMGFDPFISIADFDYNDIKAGLVSETSTFNKIIGVLEEHIKEKPGTPLFEMVVTIQNHGKYNNKYRITDTLFDLKEGVSFSETDLNILSNYFYGITDCDRELRRLVDYLQELGEPAVVVYYGDHQPVLGGDIYSTLLPRTDDRAYNTIRRYTVPFIIWENDAYKATKAESGQSGAYPEPPSRDMGVFSANYLGVKLFSMLGFGGINPYYDFCLGLMDDYPIILENRYIDGNNELHDIDIDGDHELNLYRSWGYYLLTH
jgi:phosphoglycerol transferase MdoB-like AlkP superfamily enzyme